jgi:Ca-activated chloride channel family protein
MNAIRFPRAVRRGLRTSAICLTTLFLTFVPRAAATTELLLSRDVPLTQAEYTGLVQLTVNPGIENAKVAITVDGEKIADGLRSPYRVTVDFGPRSVEHRISVVASTLDHKRVQWQCTVNRGHLPLSLKLQPVDLANRTFEVKTTAPQDDPIASVTLWDAGQAVTEVTEAPYRFAVPANLLAQGFIQVTARTKSGEEAADFWSASGEAHVETVEVHEVPIFVSVVDGNGVTQDKVDRALFKVMDNGSEAKIIEFGRAFDQPISIALLLDASASMTYAMDDVSRAALGFVRHALKSGDRCAVFAIRDTPRRQQELTGDRTEVEKALASIHPAGRTALYDALETAIRELRDEKNRRAIVVLTDGGDTESVASYADIQKTAREAGIPMYFIAFDSGTASSAQDFERLRFLATETGGFVAAASQQDLAAKYGEIERDLRAQFAIKYQVTDYAKHNEWRKIRVVLNSPKLVARTIGGYFAP